MKRPTIDLGTWGVELKSGRLFVSFLEADMAKCGIVYRVTWSTPGSLVDLIEQTILTLATVVISGLNGCGKH